MMKINFNTGDVVYHWRWGRGTVTRIRNFQITIVSVLFDAGTIEFEWPPRGVTPEITELSFIPYTLEKGGLTQVRQRPNIEIGTPIYVKDDGDIMWKYGKFDGWSGSKVYTKLITTSWSWDMYSLTPPLL